MPVFATKLQKNFTLNLVGGLPQGIVENTDGIHWLRCCPLCGCTHQIIGVDGKLPYTPLCQKLPLMYKAQLVTWRKLYPDVTQYTSLHLTARKNKKQS